MLLQKIKISHKLIFMTAAGLIILSVFAIGMVINGKGEIDALENIYSTKLIPLDNLRNVQLILREIDYRVVGVLSTAESSEEAGRHLQQAMKKLDKIWAETSGKFTTAEIKGHKKKFEQAFGSFKKLAEQLLKAYMDDNVDAVDLIHEKWILLKPTVFKSIDSMAEIQNNAVKAYKFERKKVVSTISSVVIIALLLVIAIFLVFGFVLSRSITGPVNNAIIMLQDIARGKGDLTKRLTVDSKDEIGILATWFNKFMDGMQNMVKELLGVSREVSSASRSIRDTSRLVNDSAKTQMEAIETTFVSAEEVSSSIKAITSDTEELQKFTEDASSSSYEISSVISEIAQHSEELDSLTDATVSSVNQIAVSLKQVASSIEILFSETEIVAATMIEMSKSINEVSSFSKEQAVVSGRVRENASVSGIEAIIRTREGIEKIKEEVMSVAGIVNELGDMSKEIGKIIGVINGITDATNLLSLNAAILSAQAGEHGKGFAVVADEVKNLADSTAYKTKEIAELINKVQGKISDVAKSTEHGLGRVEEGVKLSEDAESALTAIIESSEVSLEMAKKIERAVDEQSSGVNQITENIQRVNSMVDEIRKATEEQDKAADNIVISTENVRNQTHMVKKSTSEQSTEINALSKAVTDASEKMKAISLMTNEQRKAVENILNSIETVGKESENNFNLAAELDKLVKNLESQGDTLNVQIESFKV